MTNLFSSKMTSGKIGDAAPAASSVDFSNKEQDPVAAMKAYRESQKALNTSYGKSLSNASKTTPAAQEEFKNWSSTNTPGVHYTPDVPQDQAQQKTFMGFLGNVGTGLKNMGEGLATAVMHPFDTAENVASAWLGAAASVAGVIGDKLGVDPELLYGKSGKPGTASGNATADAIEAKMREFLTKNSDRIQKEGVGFVPGEFANALYEKPVEIASVAAGPLAGGLAKVGDIAEAAGATKLAATANVASKVVGATDVSKLPGYVAGKGLDAAADIVSGVSKTAKKEEAAASILNHGGRPEAKAEDLAMKAKAEARGEQYTSLFDKEKAGLDRIMPDVKNPKDIQEINVAAQRALDKAGQERADAIAKIDNSGQKGFNLQGSKNAKEGLTFLKKYLVSNDTEMLPRVKELSKQSKFSASDIDEIKNMVSKTADPYTGKGLADLKSTQMAQKAANTMKALQDELISRGESVGVDIKSANQKYGELASVKEALLDVAKKAKPADPKLVWKITSLLSRDKISGLAQDLFGKHWGEITPKDINSNLPELIQAMKNQPEGANILRSFINSASKEAKALTPGVKEAIQTAVQAGIVQNASPKAEDKNDPYYDTVEPKKVKSQRDLID